METASVTMLGTRVVQRPVPAGTSAYCIYEDCVVLAHRIMFQAKNRSVQVIANVYEDGRWNRVEHFHEECYLLAGEPYGPVPEEGKAEMRRVRDQAK